MKITSGHILSGLFGALAMSGAAIYADIMDTPERSLSFLRSDLQEVINVTELAQADLQNIPEIRGAFPQPLEPVLEQARSDFAGADPSNFSDITDTYLRTAAINTQMSAMCESFRQIRSAHMEFVSAAAQNDPNFDLSDNPHLDYMRPVTIGEAYCDEEGHIRRQERQVINRIWEIHYRS